MEHPDEPPPEAEEPAFITMNSGRVVRADDPNRWIESSRTIATGAWVHRGG